MRQFKTLLFVLLFLFAFSISAKATDIQIQQIVVPNWQSTISPVYLRITNDPFTDSTGVFHPGGPNGYFQIQCTVNTVSKTLTIPVITLASTTDSLDNSRARYNAFFVDKNGRVIQSWENLNNFQIPPTIASLSGCSPSGTCASWTDLRLFNGRNLPALDRYTYTDNVIELKIAANGIGPLQVPTYITQTPSASLNNEFALSLLGNGLLKNTTGTGVLSIAVAGTDFQAPISVTSPITFSSNTVGINQSLLSIDWSQLLSIPATFPPSAHTHAAPDIVSGTIATARLGSGTANSTTFLRGDQTWATIVAGVTDVSNSNGTLTISPTTGSVVASLNLSNANTWLANQTFGSDILRTTNPRIITGLSDTNGNSMLTFSPTASAVNGFTLTNAATANPSSVTMEASGTDSNVDLQLKAKGTGRIFIGGNFAGGQVGSTRFSGSGTGTESIIVAPNDAQAYIGMYGSGGFPQIRFTATANAENGHDLFIGRGGSPANFKLGDNDAALPVAQTISVQNVSAGTSNVAGVNTTFDMSRGTGTGNGGSFIVRVASAGSSGSTQNPLVTALTIASTTNATFVGTVTVPDDAYNASSWDGNLTVPTKNAIRDKIESISGGGITSLNGLGATSQTFAKVDDTNVTLAISSVTSTHTFTLGWTGTLAKARQNAATVYNDQANTITAYLTVDRLTISPSTLTYDLAGSVLAVGQLIPFSATPTIATGKIYNHVRFSKTGGGYNVFDIQGTGSVVGMDFELQADSTSGSSSQLHALIGAVSNKSSGTAKGVYGRAIGETGSTGTVIALVGALNAQAGNTAYIVQLTGDDGTDVAVKIHADNLTNANFAEGIQFDSTVRMETGGSFFSASSTAAHNGAFLRYKNGAGGNDLFSVDKDGLTTFGNASLLIYDTDGTHKLNIKPGSNLTADRILTLTTGDAARGITMAGDINIGGNFTTSGAFALTFTLTGATNVTVPTTGTLATLADRALVFISTQTASSSATIDFTSGLDDTYDSYVVTFDSIKPASDDVELWLRIGTGGTPTYQTSGYGWQNVVIIGGSAAPFSTSDAKIVLSGGSGTATLEVGNAAGEAISGVLQFSNPEASNFCNMIYDTSFNRALDSLTARVAGGGAWNTSGAITAVRFLFESGNIASGRFTLYGRKKS